MFVGEGSKGSIMSKIHVFISIFTITLLQAAPSCEKPLTILEDSLLELTEDIVISQRGTPFIASKAAGAKITITSKTGKSIIIARNALWDLTSFDAETKIIEFAGNARLIFSSRSTDHF